MTEKACELLKVGVWSRGREAVNYVIGYNTDPEETKENLDKALDEALLQMPDKEFVLLYNKYCEKVYATAICNASDCIPDAIHIERVDEILEELGIYDDIDDFEAAKIAQSDGIKLIDDIDGIYKNFYVDTEDNRKIIEEYITEHPEQLWKELMGVA
jgi:hypothetical protein